MGRRGRRVVGAVAVTVLVVLVAVELAAAPLVARFASARLGDCLPHEHLTVERLRRPALTALARGRVEDVAAAVSGARVEALRVARLELRMSDWPLPWAPASALPGTVEVAARVEEADLARAVAERGFLGLRPSLELAPGVVELRLPPVPFTLRLEPEISGDQLRLVPVGGEPGWWQRLELSPQLTVPASAEVTGLRITADAVLAAGSVDGAALDVDGGCELPW